MKSSDTSNGRSYAHILNNLAYSYYSLDKKDLAKKYFEEYVNAYPGSNSYDSMGEFYYNEKDYEKSLKNYVNQLLMTWTFMIIQKQSKNTKMKSLTLKTLKKT